MLNSYFGYVKTLQQLGILISKGSHVSPHVPCQHIFGSFGDLFGFAMNDSIGTAHEPLLPLQRWIQYTQAELRQVRAELQHRIEEEHAVRRIQQAQLDSLQVQLRDHGQQQSEFSDQIAELANAIAELYQQINLLRQTVNQAMNDVLRHFDSPPVVNATQTVDIDLTATQPEFHSS